MENLIGKSAPKFQATAIINGNEVINNFSLKQYINKKYVVFFFYPKDFTFVCPTELHAFQDKLQEFEKRNTVVVGCSIDSEAAHYAWLNTPKGLGGIQGVTYPLVSDINKTISEDFGVLSGSLEEDLETGELLIVGEQIAFRGLFLIDKNGIVQHEVINNFPLGRSVDEVLRMVDALQHFEKHGEVCPANWHNGSKAMVPTQDGLKSFFN